MQKKILLIILTLFVVFYHLSYASEKEKILPLKKPILSDSELKKKVLINILKPLKKPKKTQKKIVSNEIIEKDLKKPKYLLPKKKPFIAGKDNKLKSVKSKFYSKKDFIVAKKAVAEMKKANWSTALNTAKKAKDKSIYNFIQWRHLLTKGNKGSFYDYLNFINANKDYPRIGRIKYLSEHKLSNQKISPEKVINWFQNNEPLSGYGKMILGESYVMSGQLEKGEKQIKDGWITAELSKTD